MPYDHYKRTQSRADLLARMAEDLVEEHRAKQAAKEAKRRGHSGTSQPPPPELPAADEVATIAAELVRRLESRH